MYTHAWHTWATGLRSEVLGGFSISSVCFLWVLLKPRPNTSKFQSVIQALYLRSMKHRLYVTQYITMEVFCWYYDSRCRTKFWTLPRRCSAVLIFYEHNNNGLCHALCHDWLRQLYNTLMTFPSHTGLHYEHAVLMWVLLFLHRNPVSVMDPKSPGVPN